MDKTYVYSNSDQLYFDYGDDKDDGAGCDDYDDNKWGAASQRTPGNEDSRWLLNDLENTEIIINYINISIDSLSKLKSLFKKNFLIDWLIGSSSLLLNVTVSCPRLLLTANY